MTRARAQDLRKMYLSRHTPAMIPPRERDVTSAEDVTEAGRADACGGVPALRDSEREAVAAVRVQSSGRRPAACRCRREWHTRAGTACSSSSHEVLITLASFSSGCGCDSRCSS